LEMETDYAAAAISAGVAETVLGSSPSLLTATEAKLRQLAHEVTSTVMD
jgi:hypothetical protein